MALSITDFARMGGKARAQKLTKEERSESARKAVTARWAKFDKALKEAEQTQARTSKKLDALVKLNRANTRKRKKAAQ